MQLQITFVTIVQACKGKIISGLQVENQIYYDVYLKTSTCPALKSFKLCVLLYFKIVTSASAFSFIDIHLRLPTFISKLKEIFLADR